MCHNAIILRRVWLIAGEGGLVSKLGPILILSLVSLVASASCSALAATLSLHPIDSSVSVGDTIIVECLVSDVAGLYGCGGEISYPTEILEFLSGSEGDFLNDSDRIATIFAADDDPITGTVTVGVTRSNYLDGGTSTSVARCVIVLRFIAIAPGLAQVQFDRSSLIAADGITKIPHNIENASITITLPTFVVDNVIMLESSFSVEPAYPNPFNSLTRFDLRMNRKSHVQIQIYDVLGRQVEYVFEGELAYGRYQFSIDSDQMASGLYFVRVMSDVDVRTLKIMYLK